MHKQILKLVFSKPAYVGISISVFAAMMILLFAAQEYLFFEPYIIFHIPNGMFPSFVSIIVVSALIGLVTSLSVFQICNQRANAKKMGSGLVGSFIGAGAGVCTSCGAIGFSLISILGVAGASALTFLTYYEFPIRLVAIGILSITYLVIVRGMTMECKINANEKYGNQT
ncbi:MAG: hypothetical protein WD717_07570 [Nitrosarchaeum sp.]